MPIRDTLTPRAITGRVATPVLGWPTDDDKLAIELDEALFTSGEILVSVEASFDSGQSFRLVSTDVVESGVTKPRQGRGAGPATIALGFTPKPTHVRLSMDRVRGVAPVCGLRSNAESI